MDCSSRAQSRLNGLNFSSALFVIRVNLLHPQPSWGPFIERPGKLTGPVSYFEIEVSRKVGCVLTSNEVYFFFFS